MASPFRQAPRREQPKAGRVQGANTTFHFEIERQKLAAASELPAPIDRINTQNWGDATQPLKEANLQETAAESQRRVGHQGGVRRA